MIKIACKVCKKEFFVGDERQDEVGFCPYCGAKMQGAGTDSAAENAGELAMGEETAAPVLDKKEQAKLDKLTAKTFKLQPTADRKGFSVVGLRDKNAAAVVIPEFFKGKPILEIGGKAFHGNERLTNVVLGENVTRIKDWAFEGCVNLVNVTFGQRLTAIGSGAFNECKQLTDVVLPKRVAWIGNCAFRFCENLREIVIPDGVTQIEELTFFGCRRLASVTLGSGLQVIGVKAFYDSGLTEIVIPDGVTVIGDRAFYECRCLEKMVVPESVKVFGSYAFYGCACLVINCEMGRKPSKWTDGWNGTCPVVWDYKNNQVATDGFLYTKVEGIRYALKKGFAGAVVVMQPRNIQTAILPDAIVYEGKTYQVTYVKDNAFNGCKELTEAVIGDGVQMIGCAAFQDCGGLKSVVIGRQVKSIGGYAFQYCNLLASVKYRGTKKEWLNVKLERDWCSGVIAQKVECSDGQEVL